MTHAQTMNVDEFVSSSEQIWRNLASHHLFISGCSAVNGCRQNESPNRRYKHHINPHHSSPSVYIVKLKAAFVRTKSIEAF